MKRESILCKIGKSVRTTRKANGMSQEQLAEKAHLHSTFIGRLERGEVNLSVLSLEKIANALDSSIYELIDSGAEAGVQRESVKRLLETLRRIVEETRKAMGIAHGMKDIKKLIS